MASLADRFSELVVSRWGVSVFRQCSEPEAASGQGNRSKSVIMVFLPGGPSHLDIWDLKPDAPVEIRGEFSTHPDSDSGNPDLRTLATARATPRPVCHHPIPRRREE